MTLVSISCPARAAEENDLPRLGPNSSVTIPYAELRSLWQAAQPKPPAAAKPPAPPVAASLQAARYVIELPPGAGTGEARGRATFEVLALAEGWTAVPLLPAAEARLVSVEPADALLTVREGVLTLLLDGAGRRTVTLHFTADVAVASGGGHPTLRLTPPAALVNELTVANVPAGSLAEVAGAARETPAGDDANAPARFHLAAGQPLSLSLVRVEERQPAPPPGPSRWRVEAQALVRWDEGRLVYRERLRTTAEGGAGLTLNLALPAGANVLAVTGPDLERWRVTRGADAGESRRLEIAWKTPDTLAREVFLTFELPQPGLEGELPLNTPRPASGEENGGTLASALYVLPAVPGLEFASANADGAAVPTGDPRLLPRWLAEAVGSESFITVWADAARENGHGSVRARRLPLVRTASATVEEARFRTRLVADGALLSEGALAVRHEGAGALGLALPENSQLLGCTVEGRETAPVDRGGGRIEIALPSAPGAGKPTRVAFSYASRGQALAPMSGQVTLSLPQTELFVQTLLWDLQIPDAYELSALEGNVELLPASAAATAPPAENNHPAVIYLRKELLRTERPTAELFYQKRSASITP